MKSPTAQKCVLHIVTSCGCFSFTVQNDVCARFDTRRMFSHLSAEAESLCVSLCESQTTSLEDNYCCSIRSVCVLFF